MSETLNARAAPYTNGPLARAGFQPAPRVPDVVSLAFVTVCSVDAPAAHSAGEHLLQLNGVDGFDPMIRSATFQH